MLLLQRIPTTDRLANAAQRQGCLPLRSYTIPHSSCSCSPVVAELSQSALIQRRAIHCQASCSASVDRKPTSTRGMTATKEQRTINMTTYGANAWQAHFAQSGKTVLVDPWLVGKLTFADQNWLFEGSKGLQQELDVDAIAAKADLLIISQGLPDHAHKPTLERLPKDMPVVCSPTAAKILAGLGFKNVFELDHGQCMSFCDSALQICATEGALVGPPWSKRENGFVITETCSNGARMYYEPHCDYSQQSLEDLHVAPVDVIFTPVTTQEILAYPLVQGATNIVRLIQQLRPKVVVPLINADFPTKGPLASLLKEIDSPDTLISRLQGAGLADVHVQMPAAVTREFAINIPA